MEVEELMTLVSVALVVVGAGAGLFAVRLSRGQPWRFHKHEDASWLGTAFDTKEVTHRIQLVRKDYLTELHVRRRSQTHAQGLITAARRVIGRLSYFRRFRDEEKKELNHR